MSNPLSCLLSADVTPALEQVKSDLQTKGWTLLTDDGNYLYDSVALDKLFNDFNDFCQSGQGEEYRMESYPKNRFGYFATDRKHGYRFMTGSRIDEFNFPTQIKEWKEAALKCDELSKKIYNTSGEYLFYDSKRQISLVTKTLPLVHDSKEGSFGLFDIVKYIAAKDIPEQYQGTDIQVKEHADPGLFSISLGSRNEGLEMYDPSINEWFAVPTDAIVLWCGHEVTSTSKGAVKPGVHRIKTTQEVRLTAWFELCTIDQIPKRGVTSENKTEKIKMINEYDVGVSMSKSLKLDSDNDNQEELKRIQEFDNGISMSKSLDLGDFDNDGQENLKRLDEYETGVSMSKSMRLTERGDDLEELKRLEEFETGVSMSKSMRMSDDGIKEKKEAEKSSCNLQ